MRRKIKQRFGFEARTMASHNNRAFAANGEPNYNNPRVLEIKEQLGPFEYPNQGHESNDGQIRKRRPLATLENGAQFEGEWNESTNKRDGRGS